MVAVRVLVVLSLSLVMSVAMAGNRKRPRPEEPVPPNVIIVMTDDQGYGDLSANGNPVLRTPNLDQLASQSVRLTDFLCRCRLPHGPFRKMAPRGQLPLPTPGPGLR